MLAPLRARRQNDNHIAAMPHTGATGIAWGGGIVGFAQDRIHRRARFERDDLAAFHPDPFQHRVEDLQPFLVPCPIPQPCKVGQQLRGAVQVDHRRGPERVERLLDLLTSGAIFALRNVPEHEELLIPIERSFQRCPLVFRIVRWCGPQPLQHFGFPILWQSNA